MDLVPCITLPYITVQRRVCCGLGGGGWGLIHLVPRRVAAAEPLVHELLPDQLERVGGRERPRVVDAARGRAEAAAAAGAVPDLHVGDRVLVGARLDRSREGNVM